MLHRRTHCQASRHSVFDQSTRSRDKELDEGCEQLIIAAIFCRVETRSEGSLQRDNCPGEFLQRRAPHEHGGISKRFDQQPIGFGKKVFGSDFQKRSYVATRALTRGAAHDHASPGPLQMIDHFCQSLATGQPEKNLRTDSPKAF